MLWLSFNQLENNRLSSKVKIREITQKSTQGNAGPHLKLISSVSVLSLQPVNWIELQWLSWCSQLHTWVQALYHRAHIHRQTKKLYVSINKTARKSTHTHTHTHTHSNTHMCAHTHTHTHTVYLSLKRSPFSLARRPVLLLILCINKWQICGT